MRPDLIFFARKQLSNLQKEKLFSFLFSDQSLEIHSLVIQSLYDDLVPSFSTDKGSTHDRHGTERKVILTWNLLNLLLACQQFSTGTQV